MSDFDLFLPQKSESHRQKRVAEEIRYHLAKAFVEGNLPLVRNASNSGFISFSFPLSVSRVEVSADLKQAYVYISVLEDRESDSALGYVKQQRGYLRKLIAQKIKLRYTPDLHFKIDQHLDQATMLLDKISKVRTLDEEKRQTSIPLDDRQEDL